MRLIIFSQPSIFIRGHLHAQLEHGWWHRAITIPPHLDTQIKDLRPNATGIWAPIERFLYKCDSYTSIYSTRNYLVLGRSNDYCRVVLPVFTTEICRRTKKNERSRRRVSSRDMAS